jgi:hypothetical protein
MMVIMLQDPLGIPEGFIGTLAIAVQESPENVDLFVNEKT